MSKPKNSVFKTLRQKNATYLPDKPIPYKKGTGLEAYVR
jgi:hypothetical protein